MEQENKGSGAVDEAKLQQYQAAKTDAVGLVRYLEQYNPELLCELERVPQEHWNTIARLQLVAVQYGRAIERKEWEPFFSRKLDEQLNPPKPALQLVATNGQAISGIKVDQSLAQASRDFKASDLLVVPGGQLPPKRG